MPRPEQVPRLRNLALRPRINIPDLTPQFIRVVTAVGRLQRLPDSLAGFVKERVRKVQGNGSGENREGECRYGIPHFLAQSDANDDARK